MPLLFTLIYLAHMQKACKDTKILVLLQNYSIKYCRNTKKTPKRLQKHRIRASVKSDSTFCRMRRQFRPLRLTFVVIILKKQAPVNLTI